MSSNQANPEQSKDQGTLKLNVQGQGQTTQPQDQAAPPIPQSPLEGDSRTAKTVEYLKRLRQAGKFDPNLPLSNEDAKRIAKEVSSIIGEEVSPSTIREARTRLLKEPVQKALKPSDTSQPQLKEKPLEPIKPLTGEGPAAPSLPVEKPPLKPEEIEANKKFFDRVLNWLNKKVDAKVDQDDQSFIVGTLTDACTDAKSKVPLGLKVIISVAMIITLYVLPAFAKVKSKFQKPKLQG